MMTVTALCPTLLDAVPAMQLPAEAGVAGVLLVELDDGRRIGLVQEHLLEALTFIGAGRQVIDEHDVVSLEQYDTDQSDQVLLQLRVGAAGDEIASWVCDRAALFTDLRRCWALVEDAAYAWGDTQLLNDLHDLGGAWSRNLQAAQQHTVSV